MTALPVGVLEELDGTPIRPRPVPRITTSWPRAMAAATAAAATRPRLWVFALLAFLVRGGLVALVVPILVLPTFIGLSNVVGPTSVTAAGPTPRLVAMIATWLGISIVAILVGTLVGAAAEVALLRAMVAPGAGRGWSGGGQPGGGRAGFPLGAIAVTTLASGRAARRVATVRLALLLPVAIAVTAAVPAWVQVGYRELLLPTDLAVPLPVRVVAGEPGTAAAVGATWLAAEVLGGLAARRIALYGSSVAGALGAAAMGAVRAPASFLLTLAVAIAGSLPLLVPAVALVGVAWEHARFALVDGTDPVGVILGALVLVAAWAGCLVVAGATAAWRSALWTAELARHARPR